MLTVLCKSYGAENAPGYGCVSCVMFCVCALVGVLIT